MDDRILLIEDCLATQVLLKAALGKKYTLACVSNPEDGRLELAKGNVSLVILDVELPSEDGFHFFAKMKTHEKYKDIPVVFLTGKQGVSDKVLGFSLGADDYVTKPFEPIEFQARIDAKMRRLRDLETQGRNIRKGSFRIEFAQRRIFFVDGDAERDLDLTSSEFKLLCYFINHEDHVLSRGQILEHLSGSTTHVSERTVDTHIYTLRKKLGTMAGVIQAVTGAGYRFAESGPRKKRAA